jgi:hypothetical protein
MAPLTVGNDTPGMEAVGMLLAVALGFGGVVSAVLWAIAVMTGGTDEELRRP